MIAKAMTIRDYEVVRSQLVRRFVVDLDIYWIRSRIAAVKWSISKSRWSDASWFSWWRNRLSESGFFHAGCELPAANWASVTTHCFFVSLLETPSMLARLPEEAGIRTSGESRSKISKANEVIRPVDRTARRVVPDWPL